PHGVGGGERDPAVGTEPQELFVRQQYRQRAAGNEKCSTSHRNRGPKYRMARGVHDEWVAGSEKLKFFPGEIGRTVVRARHAPGSVGKGRGRVERKLSEACHLALVPGIDGGAVRGRECSQEIVTLSLVLCPTANDSIAADQAQWSNCQKQESCQQRPAE